MTVLDQGFTNGFSKWLASKISDTPLLITIRGTLVVDKEIDLLNARREIRVRIPG